MFDVNNYNLSQESEPAATSVDSAVEGLNDGLGGDDFGRLFGAGSAVYLRLSELPQPERKREMAKIGLAVLFDEAFGDGTPGFDVNNYNLSPNRS